MLKATWRFNSALDKEQIAQMIDERLEKFSEFGLLECNLWVISELMYSHFREERKYLLEELWVNQKYFDNWMQSEERKNDIFYTSLTAQNVIFVAYTDAKLSGKILVSSSNV